jgi:hypothetical protein
MLRSIHNPVDLVRMLTTLDFRTTCGENETCRGLSQVCVNWTPQVKWVGFPKRGSDQTVRGTRNNIHTGYFNGPWEKKKQWSNLKGSGHLTVKTGDGEQIYGMVSGLGSVSSCPLSTPWQRRWVELTDVLVSWHKEPRKTHRVVSSYDFVGGRRTWGWVCSIVISRGSDKGVLPSCLFRLGRRESVGSGSGRSPFFWEKTPHLCVYVQYYMFYII